MTVVTGRSVSRRQRLHQHSGHRRSAATSRFSAYYNRSLRFRDDTVSFGITFVLRGNRHSSLSDDELLRAINQEIQKPAPTGHSVNP